MTVAPIGTEDHAADPWWGVEDAPVVVEQSVAVPVRRPAPTIQLPALVAIPLAATSRATSAIGRRLAANERVRKATLRAAIVLAAVAVITGSVGVILLNNTVIRRTAELSELDDRRRELRLQNAILGADAARLRAPEHIEEIARRKLGMSRAQDLPEFVYLDGTSHAVTPADRARLRARAAAARARRARVAAARAARAERAEQAAAAREQAAAAATAPTTSEER